MPSDNTTEAIDHLTEAMQGINTSLDAFTVALTAAAVLIAGVMQFGRLFEFALFLGLLVVALWSKDFILAFIAGIVTILIGVLWIDDYPGVSVTLWGLAVYLIVWKGLLGALGTLGSSKGLSQFKGLYNRAREKF